jgi:hypothetical protein
MGFLSGPITWECYRVGGAEHRQFGAEHVKILERFAAGQNETSSLEEADVGFLAGDHLFDGRFSLEKNVIGDALHCAIRIDTNQIPSAVRRAWLQIELAALSADNPSGRPTKLQRQEARDAVAARSEEEARSGKFRKMQQFPLLWDARQGLLYFGGSSSTAGEHCCDLCARAFELELSPLSAGRRAQEWAAEAKRNKALEDALPATFLAGDATADIDWWNHEAGNYDFLGNEFLLWVWWRWETQSDSITLSDDTEVTGMLARTLSLQCPRGESGKETITAEGPSRLPEAAQAIRSGKLPRKAGLILVRCGEQYEFVLQAETFAVSGARIRIEEAAEESGPREAAAVEDRIESLRGFQETIDLLFRAFCTRRIGKNWAGELDQMRRWLKGDAAGSRKRTA